MSALTECRPPVAVDAKVTSDSSGEPAPPAIIAKTRLNTNRASTKKKFIFWPPQAWQQQHRQPQEQQREPRQQAWQQQLHPQQAHRKLLPV
jgi:hypothetical protein